MCFNRFLMCFEKRKQKVWKFGKKLRFMSLFCKEAVIIIDYLETIWKFKANGAKFIPLSSSFIFSVANPFFLFFLFDHEIHSSSWCCSSQLTSHWNYSFRPDPDLDWTLWKLWLPGKKSKHSKCISTRFWSNFMSRYRKNVAKIVRQNQRQTPMEFLHFFLFFLIFHEHYE